MTPSKILFWFSVSFIVGVALVSFAPLPIWFSWAFLLVALALFGAAFFRARKNAAVFAFCALFFLLGISRFQLQDFFMQQDVLRQYNDQQAVTFSGYVSQAPDIRQGYQKITVTSGKSQVLVTTDLSQQYVYLETVTIKGKLQTPKVYDDFNYQDYLKNEGIYSVMEYPTITVTGKKSATVFSNITSGIIALRQKMNAVMTDTFPSPQAPLLEGFLLGENTVIPDAVSTALNNTGLRFLTAISGMHVIIISSMLAALFLALGLWRRQALVCSLAFIWLYIALTGFTASGIRAGIMGSLLLLAEIFGRQNTSARTIVLAAALMLAENPFLLRYDLGFQLSFIASMGIIYFKPLMDSLIEPLFAEHFVKLRDIVSVTLTAQLFTLPLMIFSFGIVSFSALITNLLIVPIFYWMLLFGFLFALCSLIFYPLGFLFAAPVWLLLNYFLFVMQLFNQPWGAIQTTDVLWMWPVLWYVLIIVGTWYWQKKTKFRF